MSLISSKLVKLTLFVIFLSGCAASTPEPAQSLASSLTPSVTLALTPFPTAPSPTKTTFPTNTPELLTTATPTSTSTPLPTNVAIIPEPQGYTWEIIADGFSRPTGLASPMDDSGRLFVLEQEGLIHIILGGQVLPIPFLDLREITSTSGSTVRGLQGMTFHPDYAQNGIFFVHYSQEGGSSVIAQYRLSADPNLADPRTETRLLEINYPIGEHVGGGLAFGPDGYLYASIGDGGAGGNGDAAGNAQNADTYLGSLLHIHPDGNTAPQVWATGLRNPWRFSFDSLNGDLYIADVGENKSEEINFLPAGNPPGANFGWNFYEGDQVYKGSPPDDLDLVFPVWAYDHSLGCSVTGGMVYRGQSIPEWFGVYFYGDYCTGNIWGLLQNPDGSWQNTLLYQLPAYITSFGQDQAGEIYMLSITGKVYKFIESPSAE